MEDTDQLISPPQPDSVTPSINQPASSPTSRDVTSRDASDERHYVRRPVSRLITVEPLLLFIVFSLAGNGIITQYVYHRVASELNYSNYSVAQGSECTNQSQEEIEVQKKVQEASTMYVMLNSVASLLPGILATILVGSYSDKAGRKYGILPQICSGVVRLIIQIVVMAAELPLYGLIIATFIGALTGSENCIIMMCYTYIADITTNQQRSLRLFVALVTMILGGTIASLAVSYLIVGLGFMYACLCYIPLYILAFLYAAFVLPEPIIADRTAKLFHCGHFCRAFKIYKKKTVPPRTAKLLLCVFVIVIGNYCSTGSLETYTLYFFNKPFCWGTLDVGYYMAYLLLLHGVSGLIIVRVTASWMSDEVRVIIGTVSGVLYFIAIGFAYDKQTAFIAPVFGIATSLVSPMARSAATKLVQPEEQGRLQATMSPVEQAGGFASSWVSNILYAESVQLSMHGLLYFVLAGLLGVDLILAITLLLLSRKWKSQETLLEQPAADENEDEPDNIHKD